MIKIKSKFISIFALAVTLAFVGVSDIYGKSFGKLREKDNKKKTEGKSKASSKVSDAKADSSSKSLETLPTPPLSTDSQDGSNVNLNVNHLQLDNGLHVLIYESKQSPTVACRLFFTTGSVHEGPGRTGIAHMLEHMLFKGTKKVGIKDSVQDAVFMRKIDSIQYLIQQTPTSDTLVLKGYNKEYNRILNEHRKIFIAEELWGAYLKEGGTELNAFTSDLLTAYYVTLPKNKMELFLWLEADRMQNAILREFYPERDVVMEERRMRYEDSPLGRYFESLTSIFYEAHPYRLPTIGYASDIANLTRQQADEHYKKYYKPNNAILVLVGDLNVKNTIEMVKKYFDKIPKGEEHAKVVTVEPEPIGQKRLVLKKNEAVPRMDFWFLTPGFPHNDIYALDILEGVLSGNSGRLYKKLVKELKIATNVSAGNRVDKYHSSFSISVQMGSDPKPAEVEKAVWEVISDLNKELITERELQRVKNQVKAYTLRKLQDPQNLATELAMYQLWGTWEYINIYPTEVQKVSAVQMQEVVKKYILEDKSTVGVVLPEAGTEKEKSK